MKKVAFPLYVTIHPVEGFEELVWNKALSVPASIVVLALWFVAAVFERQLTGFSHNTNNPNTLNVLYVMIRTGGVFCLWVLANRLLSTVLDGRGDFRDIWVVSSYALVPYVLLSLLVTGLSNLLVQDEQVFLSWLRSIGWGWSAALMISAIKSVHEFSFPRSVWACFLSLIGIVLVVFVMLLMVSLFTQVYVFVRTVVSETLYMTR